MKTELTPQEVAKKRVKIMPELETAKKLEQLAMVLPNGNQLIYAASIVRKVVNGELAPVRCGECKYFKLHPNDDFADNAGICTKNTHCCDFSSCEADRFITDFCSYGERKDEIK